MVDNKLTTPVISKVHWKLSFCIDRYLLPIWPRKVNTFLDLKLVMAKYTIDFHVTERRR